MTRTTRLVLFGAAGAIGLTVVLYFTLGLSRKTSAENGSKWDHRKVKLAKPLAMRNFQRGVALGIYGDKKGLTMMQGLKEIKALGATHVSMVVAWQQKNIHSNTIVRKPKPSYRDPIVKGLIREARRLKLKVFLFPIIRLVERGDNDWRGTIKPTDLNRWFASYTSFILHYAQMARDEKVDLFSVGSELVSMEKKRDRWLKLIGQVRSIYKGKLIYSANWDHYSPVTFWDQVDYVGITGYYKLTEGDNPTLADLVQKWNRIRAKISGWQKAIGRPVIFTELGYHSRDGVNRHPWDYTTKAPIDLKEQFDCYHAFFHSWNGSKILGGVYFWIWWNLGGPKDGHYTPRGKPAVRIIKHWFKNLPN